jgi:hypothetical protein
VDVSEDAHGLAAKAARALQVLTGVESFDVALVMGSGWVPAADAIGTTIAEHPVTEPVGAAPLDGLPDRREPEALTRVDGEVGVLPLEVFEGV